LGFDAGRLHKAQSPFRVNMAAQPGPSLPDDGQVRVGIEQACTDAPRQCIAKECCATALRFRECVVVEQVCPPKAVRPLAGADGCSHLQELLFKAGTIGEIRWQFTQYPSDRSKHPTISPTPENVRSVWTFGIKEPVVAVE